LGKAAVSMNALVVVRSRRAARAITKATAIIATASSNVKSVILIGSSLRKSTGRSEVNTKAGMSTYSTT
jgi:hypothetical protein